MTRRAIVRSVVLLLTMALARAAHGHTPLQVPIPQTVPEAWDVLRQSVANIGHAIETNQLRDVDAHVRNVGIAVRILWADATDVRKDESLARDVDEVFTHAQNVVTATGAGDAKAGAAAHALLRQHLDRVAGRYPPEVAQAKAYTCPMHPAHVTTDAAARCPHCHMRLIVRTIAASMTYLMPGESTVVMTARATSPLRVGEPTDVVVALRHHDGDRPVTHDDLLVMHTEPIHLLIIDHALSDYHHEHPKPRGDVPGEYSFTFTPRAPGPYRVFADIVPAGTGVQEYAHAELPADSTPGEVIGRDTALETTVDGLGFTLAPDGELRAGQPIPMKLTIQESTGEPCARLEPLMGAFAHLVGFHDDLGTVIHVHPLGREPERPSERGGPTLAFNFYTAKAGLIRLYAQVQLDGRSVFAPFTLNVSQNSTSD